jgi:paraquat-inducible protein B
MNVSADNRLIGLFVLGGLLLAVILTLMFGGGHYFSKIQRYVVYFEGSVNGLNTGAPVKLKGVSIGRVNDVLVQYDLENNRVLTPVIAEIDLEKVMETYGADAEHHEHPSLQDLIDRGLRARLSLQSLVTNQLYVDIDFLPDRPGTLIGQKTLGLPEIPTVASSKDEIEKTVQKLTREVRDLPLKDTVEATLGAIRRVDHLLAKPETDASINNLNRTLQDLQQLLRHLDSKVDSMTGNLDQTNRDVQHLVRHLDSTVGTLKTSIDGMVRDSRVLVSHLNSRVPPLLDSAGDSFKQAQGTLLAIEDLTEPNSELSNVLRDMSEAARSIRRLADTLERNPDNLLYGRKKSEERR